MVMPLVEQIEDDLTDAKNEFERRIDELHTLNGRIEYYRGRIDAFRLMQKHLETRIETEAV